MLAAFMGVRTDAEINATMTPEGMRCEWWGAFGPTGPFHGSHFWKLTQLVKKGRIYDYAEFMAHLAW